MSTRYDRDFYTWTQEQAQLLKERHFHLSHLEHLADEVADMGQSTISQYASRLAILIAHLLTLAVQTTRSQTNEKSWITTVKEQRRCLQRLLAKNPGLKNPSIADEVLLDVSDDMENWTGSDMGNWTPLREERAGWLRVL